MLSHAFPLGLISLYGRLIPTEKRPGEGGIRTLGTLLEYGALAKRCFRPLSHLTLVFIRLMKLFLMVNRKAPEDFDSKADFVY